jgi:Tol biopolymer transport system component
VYTRDDAKRGDCEVHLANADGSGNRVLATIPETYIGSRSGAAWSPDGHTIAVSVQLSGKRSPFVLDLVSIRDGSVRELYSSNYLIGRPLWLPEGNALLASVEEGTKGGQLWKISYPQGQARRLTNDLANYDDQIDATRNAETVAATQFNRAFNVWVADAANLSGGHQISFGEVPIYSLAAAPQGKILAVSRDGEPLIMNLDGSQPTPIPDAHNASFPASCGRYFLFSSSQRGKIGLIRVDADGSNPTIVVAQDMIGSPVCSTDLRSVFYVDLSPPTRIRRVPIEGGAPMVVANGLGTQIISRLVISPDGKFLAYGFEAFDPEPVNKLAVIPVDGSSPARVLEVPGWTFLRAPLRWSPDGKGLQSLVTREGATNIWEQPVTGGRPKQVTKFTSGMIVDFDWSPDGKQLVLTRGELNSDVVLISNFR